jgi:tetratricopeptide (TPR) repeat protein
MNRGKRPTAPSPFSIDHLLKQGLASHRAKDFKAAAACYKQILEVDPNNADALHLLGTIAGQNRDFVRAVRLIESAIRIRPGEPIFRNNLGNAFLEIGEPHLAVKQLNEAVRLNPKYIEAWCNLGKAHEACGQVVEARESYRKAVQLDSSNERARLSLARCEQLGGAAKQAVTEFRNILARQPDDPRALIGILMADKATPDMPELNLGERTLRNSNLSQTGRSALMHALGKAYNDIGRYEEAIHLIIEAKQLDGKAFDLERWLAWCELTRETFTWQFLAERINFGIDNGLPVFIVGMPRSGTTLTEQIIASHPQAYGAGELPHIGRIARIVGAKTPEQDISILKLQALTPATAAELAQGYIDRLRQDSAAAARITDKAPLNLRYLGVISLLFTRAKIIHCTRNVLDTCVSIFMQNFNSGHAYSYDLGNLGHYYRSCAELISHWKQVIPQPILEVNYEETVGDIEHQARRIIDFIGLEWDDACLRFQETQRTVATASHWQVRQPVYKTSVGRWRRYENHLGPLIESLGPLADTRTG